LEKTFSSLSIPSSPIVVSDLRLRPDFPQREIRHILTDAQLDLVKRNVQSGQRCAQILGDCDNSRLHIILTLE
jgi:hypothetical protein